MALNIKNINCTIDQLMKFAIENKFTKNGEIFEGLFKIEIIFLSIFYLLFSKLFTQNRSKLL
jgi:hypothetical protein